MRRRFGVLYLGAVHARAQLERRGHIKRRPRTDYLWALRVDASSNLYRIIDDVRCDRDRARPRRRNYRDAVRVREPLDKIALRRKAHAQAVPRAVCGLSETREAHHSVHSLNCFNRNFGGLQPPPTLSETGHLLLGMTLIEPSFSSSAARTSSMLAHPASRRAVITSWRVSLARSKVCWKSLPSRMSTSGLPSTKASSLLLR